MIIPINARYRIVSDEYQWIIQRKRTRKGKEDWQARLYYPTLKGGCRRTWGADGEAIESRYLRQCIGSRRGGRHPALPGSDTQD